MESSEKSTEKKTNKDINEKSQSLGGKDEAVATLESPEVEHIFEKLEPEEQEIIGTMVSSYSGPLPPPDYLQGYVEVYPEAAERIFQWVEENQSHRHQMEKDHLDKTFKHSRLGIIGGIILSLLFIILSFSLIILDKEVIGLTFIGGYIVSLVAIIVSQKSKKESENIEKNDDISDT